MNSPWLNGSPPVGDSIFLRILRYNGIFAQPADMKWLLQGENHLSTYPKYPQGMFTVRTFSNNERHFPTIHSSVAAGKTHGIYLWSYEKRECEKMELVIDAWLVDLVLCAKMLDQADRSGTNRSDGNKFLIFDVGKPTVQLFCRRLKIPRS